MRNKIFIFVVFFLFFLGISLVDSVSDFDDSLRDNLEDVKEGTDKVRGLTEEDKWKQKWDYLGNEWKEILLKNKLIFALDSFFTKISFLFFILFAKSYEMSLLLIGIIFLWFFIFLNGARVLQSWGIVGEGIFAYLASLAIVVLFAWMKLFETVIILLGRLAFSPSHWWTRAIILVFILFGFSFLQYLLSLVSSYLRTRKDSVRKKSSEFTQKRLKKFVDSFNRSSSTNS
jgi:hypothetical protein